MVDPLNPIGLRTEHGRKRPGYRMLPLLAALFFCALSAIPAAAQNPFTGKPSGGEQTRPAFPGRSTLLEKTLVWQQKIRTHMADQMESAKTQRSVRPLLLLILLACGYGVVHAAGPGHGKAIALSYMLSRRATLADTLLFGALVSFFHGLSAIVAILTLKMVLSGGVARAVDDITRITQVVSFSLILCLGTFLFVQALRRWVRHEKGIPAPAGHTGSSKGPFAAAAAVGLIPCPGVVMVMLFSLSLGLPWLGILLAGAITTGMALTISVAVLIGVTVKNVTIGAVKQRNGRLEHAVHCFGGLAVALLGGLFLASSLY
jgi:nickel/cobalt transporter (NicO) family protein